jgi:hypothetical protein
MTDEVKRAPEQQRPDGEHSDHEVQEERDIAESKPTRPRLEVVQGNPDTTDEEFTEGLDADELELREMRMDLPGATAGISAGLITVGVGKVPKDEFFRVRPEEAFRPVVSMVSHTTGMDTTFCTVKPHMIPALHGIKIFPARYRVYFVTTEADIWRLVPVRLALKDGSQNTWASTLEIALHRGMSEWIRIYNDPEKRDAGEGWKAFRADAGRFPEPVWPDLSMGKLMRLGFKDRGNQIDSPDHPLIKKWAGRV